MKEIYKLECLNIGGCDFVYGYNHNTKSIEVGDYHKIYMDKDIILLPYKEDLISFIEALNIYENYIYETTGVYLDLPRGRGVSRYLKSCGYYYDFQQFQEEIAKRRLERWCYRNNIYNVRVI